MRLLIWNILQGGGIRKERIADAIVAQNADIVGLLEVVPRTTEPLLSRLRAAGFAHQIFAARKTPGYQVCILSKLPVTSRLAGISLLDRSGLWLEVAVPDAGFGLGIVHAPTTPRTRMKEFLSAIIAVGKKRAAGPFLFAGDFNTGIGPADGPMNNFGDVDRFVALQAAGFTDTWRQFHGGCIEHTWGRNAKQYRIDHALASASLAPRVTGCRYLHEERLTGISDHSAIIVEVAESP